MGNVSTEGDDEFPCPSRTMNANVDEAFMLSPSSINVCFRNVWESDEEEEEEDSIADIVQGWMLQSVSHSHGLGARRAARWARAQAALENCSVPSTTEDLPTVTSGFLSPPYVLHTLQEGSSIPPSSPTPSESSFSSSSLNNGSCVLRYLSQEDGINFDDLHWGMNFCTVHPLPLTNKPAGTVYN
jgi:hypothetical protein